MSINTSKQKVCMNEDLEEIEKNIARIDIRLPLSLKKKVKEKIKNSEYTTISEVIRESLRKFVEDGEI